MNACKANLIISALLGLLAAFMTRWLGSTVWWLWGIVWALLTFTAIAACQLASISDSTTDTEYGFQYPHSDRHGWDG